MNFQEADHPESSDDQVHLPRPTFETLMMRAAKLRCPRCGRGRLFTRWFIMPDRCDACGFLYQRGPGYFLGSAYINYGLTAGILVASFMIGRMAFGVSSRDLFWPLAIFCIIFPLVIFRHARAFWLALDGQLDKTVLEDPVELKEDRKR